MKKMIFSHGDKGGVGKSIFSMLIVEYLLSQNIPVGIVETDGEMTGRNNADVGKRYKNVAGVGVLNVNLDKSGRDAENAVSSLFSRIEESGIEHIVVNAPANAYKSLDAFSDIIVPVAQDLDYETCVAWLVGKESASAELSIQSELCKLADRKMAVVNRKESEFDVDFFWFQNPKYKDAWVESGGLLGEIPELASRVATSVQAQPESSFLSLAGKESPLFMVERQIIKNWLKKSWENAVIPLVGEGE